MKKVTLFAFALFMLLGCKDETSHFFCKDHTVISSIMDSLALESEIILPADSMIEGLCDMTCTDDYIVFKNLYHQRDNLFSLYDKAGHFVASFGHIGNAGNEFSMAAQIIKRTEKSTFMVTDLNTCKIKEVDPGASVDSASLVLSRVVNGVLPMALRVQYVNDSVVYVQEMMPDNVRLVKCITSTGEALSSEELFLEPHEQAVAYFQAVDVYNPELNMMAFGMIHINQVNFLNLKTGKRKSASLYADAKIHERGEDQFIYYADVTASGKYVYFLYRETKITKAEDVMLRHPEIHVFDWEGNFVRQIVVNGDVMRICLDNQDSSVLYAYAKDLGLCRYRLPKE